MKIGAAYIRVSTDDQIEFSPDSQLKAIREYAKRNEIILPEEYIFMDEGISGRHAEKRPEFMRMIATAKLKPKPFEVILLWKFSRFARNREDSIVYKSMLRKQLGIDVVSISEQLGEDKTSILIEALLEAMDEYYSINLAEEVKRGMTEKASRGEVVSAPPFGYLVENNVFVPDGNAKMARMVFEDYAGGMGCREIALKLNAMGVKTKRGNRWENRTVEYLLSNPVYIGKLHWSPSGARDGRYYQLTPGTIVKDGKHEPIISEELFTAVNDKLKKNKRKYPKYIREPKSSDYLFKGMVRCSNCGSTLVRALGGESLQCHAYSKGNCSVSHSIKMDLLYDIVINTAKEDFKNNNFHLDLKSHKNQNTGITGKLIAKEKEKLKRVSEAYQSGVDTLEEYRANKQAILKNISEYEKQPAPAQSKKSALAEFRNRMGGALRELENPDISDSDRNKLLRQFIIKIIFYRANGTIRIFYA